MIYAAIILVLICLSFFIFFIFLADSAFGKLDFSSDASAIAQVIKIIKAKNLPSGDFYDLGSCRGNFALKIAKNFPKLRVYGIDDSKFRTAWAKIRGVFYKNVTFQTENIFFANLSAADIIYIYLPKELMPELETKLQKELKPSALVISNAVCFPNWPPKESFPLGKNKLFTYVKV